MCFAFDQAFLLSLGSCWYIGVIICDSYKLAILCDCCPQCQQRAVGRKCKSSEMLKIVVSDLFLCSENLKLLSNRAVKI